MAADLSPAGRRKSRLRAEVALLSRRYETVDFDQQDGAWVHIPRFPLPPGWNKRQVGILIDIPYGNPGYPTVPPDWFWTDRNLSTSDGRPIGHFFAGMALNETELKYLNRGWGHFCIHLAAWRPAAGIRLQDGHTLLSYLDLISTVFHDRKKLTGRYQV